MVDPTKVFISYAREDFDSAVEIYESLEQLGFQPWMDYFGPNSLGSIRSSIVSGLERRKTADVTAPVRVVTRTLRGEKKEQWSVSFAYPEFLPANAVGIPEINAALSTFAHTAKSNFIGHLEDEGVDLKFESLPHYLNVNFNLTYLSQELISVRFTEDIYTGGMHPNSYTRTFSFFRNPWINFDLGSIVLDSHAVEFIQKISEICISNIKNQRLAFWAESKESFSASVTEEAIANDPWLAKGAGPNYRNFRNFCIEPENFVFIFDPYHV